MGEHEAGERGARGVLVRHIVRSMRPQQWTKNVAVFAALIFARKACDTAALLSVIGAFAVFCLVSSAVYVLNDLADREADRAHPVKRNRPIASGSLRPLTAVAVAAFAGAAGLAWAVALEPLFCAAVAAYLLLQIAYSLFLKRVVILDVFVVATGFVLRVLGGGLVIRVVISSWLIVCTVLLSLFLALCKRRHELVLIGDNAREHREVLSHYTAHLLDQMISVVASATVMAYALYTLAPETAQKFGTRNLVFTVPFVLYGVLRYLYLVYRKGEGGEPETTLLTDPALLASVALWVSVAGIIIYL